MTADQAVMDTPLGGRILKVNHAGEHGAVHIYAAQVLVAHLTAPSLVAQLREFQRHEARHRSIFAAELQRRGVARCKSYWLCALGAMCWDSSPVCWAGVPSQQPPLRWNASCYAI